MWKYINAARAYCQHAVTKNIMKPYNFSSNYRNNASDAYIKRPNQKKNIFKKNEYDKENPTEAMRTKISPKYN